MQTNKLKELNLHPYDIQRPEQLKWFFPNTGDLLNHIKSKSLRSFLRRSDALLAAQNLTVEWTTLSKKDFQEWLPYYQEKMKENDYEIFASEAWYETKMLKQEQVRGVFILNQEQIVGSLIFTLIEKQRAVIAFKANDRLDIFPGGRSSIGAVLDFHFLRQMVSENVASISAGFSRNAFGVVNSIGNLDYKLRFGYIPQPSVDHPVSATVPLSEEGTVLFYGLQNQKLSLYAFYPENSVPTFEQERFTTEAIPFVKIGYPLSTLVE